MNDFKSLQSKRTRYYSQNGEDGVLEYLFTKIPVNRWAVEFGAWDARYLSNTYHFIKELNYSAVLIEGDEKKMADLAKNTSEFGDRVISINAFVGDAGTNTLDSILKSTPLPKDFDILSIDVDGNDYHIWEAFHNYKPKVVIIEINIKDKPEVIRVHNKQQTTYTWGVSGSSIGAITQLANKKGYALLTNIACNAIYIDKQYLPLFFDRAPSPEEVYTYEAFDLSELSLIEAKRKGWYTFLNKLIRYPYHLIKYKK